MTRRDLKHGTFCFHPKDRDDARRIQEKLLELGFCWQSTGRTEVAHLTILPGGTLLLKDGGMSCNRDRVVEGRLLDFQMLENGLSSSSAPDPDLARQYLTEMFAQVFARLDDMDERIAALEKRLPAEKPVGLDKPAFRHKDKRP